MNAEDINRQALVAKGVPNNLVGAVMDIYPYMFDSEADPTEIDIAIVKNEIVPRGARVQAAVRLMRDYDYLRWTADELIREGRHYGIILDNIVSNAVREIAPRPQTGGETA